MGCGVGGGGLYGREVRVCPLAINRLKSLKNDSFRFIDLQLIEKDFCAILVKQI